MCANYSYCYFLDQGLFSGHSFIIGVWWIVCKDMPCIFCFDKGPDFTKMGKYYHKLWNIFLA